MLAKAYRGSQRKDVVLLIHADEPHRLQDLPETVRRELGSPTYWKDVNLANSKLIGVDPAEAMRNLNERGYHLQQMVVDFEER